MEYFLKRLVNRIFKLNRRFCPVCQSSFCFFLPLPSFYKKNWAKYNFAYKAEDFETLNFREFSCPNCGSTDRDRLFALYLSNSFKPALQSRILDIAPSAGLSRWVKSNLDSKYITADLFMEGVDLKVNIENMSEIDNSEFDLVICSHVLEHVPNDQKALNELFRILKPGGQAILMVPLVNNLEKTLEDPEEKSTSKRWERFGQDDHIRLYAKGDFIKRISNSGFLVTEKSAEEIIDSPKRFGIHYKSILYIAVKPLVGF